MVARDDLRTRRWGAVAAVVLLFLILDFAAPQLGGNREWPHVAVWSMIAGQFHLIVLWGALAQVNIVVRLPVCFLALVSMWGALLAGVRADGGQISSGTSSSVTTWGAFSMGVVVFLLLLLAVPRVVLAWRWVGWEGAKSDSQRHSSQFHLKHVFLGTCLVAVALAIGRGLFPVPDRLSSDEVVAWLVTVAVMVVSFLLIAVPSFWCASVKQTKRVPIGGVYLTYCVSLGILVILILSMIFGPPRGDELLEVVLIYSGSVLIQGATVFAVLVYSRSLGCQIRCGRRWQTEVRR